MSVSVLRFLCDLKRIITSIVSYIRLTVKLTPQIKRGTLRERFVCVYLLFAEIRKSIILTVGHGPLAVRLHHYCAVFRRFLVLLRGTAAGLIVGVLGSTRSGPHEATLFYQVC